MSGDSPSLNDKSTHYTRADLSYQAAYGGETVRQAEMIVLASLITGRATNTGSLTAEQFSQDDSRVVFEEFQNLINEGKSADLVTVNRKVGKRSLAAQTFLFKLSDAIPHSDLTTDIGIIQQDYAHRQEAKARKEIATLFDSDAPLEEIGARIDKLLDSAATGDRGRLPPTKAEMIPSAIEISAARLTPTCIVKNYIYSDVATWAAPGGTGKTTISIYEATCLALKRPVHGMNIEKTGWVLFITAEDRREQLIARIREMIRAMCLAAELEKVVWEKVLIWDVTGEQQRLASMKDGNIVLTSLADDIVRAYRKNPPILVVFDPAISFGVSESFVNDNENAIITACRRIVKGLDCCVRIIAHTGKANAREGTLDQYSSRGGSALADGSRMVSVLQAWDRGNPLRPPPGCIEEEGASIVILARPKLSYSPPRLPIIWIRRKGWLLESFIDVKVAPEELDRVDQENVFQFLDSEVEAGKRHTKTTLEVVVPAMTRAKARAAITRLMVNGKIIEADLPEGEKVTKRKTYLITSAGFGRISKKDEVSVALKNPLNNAAALREENGGIIRRPLFPTDSPNPALLRQDLAGLAGLTNNDDGTGGVLCRSTV